MERQLIAQGWGVWARATRCAERCTIATFSSLARCVHHDVAVAALRQKEAALRATTLMRSSSARALAAAWITWSTAVHRADVKESTIRRMIKRLVSRLTIRALCTWRIATALSERAVQTLAARFVRRRLLLRVLRMRRSICEMIQLAAGFWKWVVYRQLSLHMRLAHVRSVTKVKRNLRRSCMRTLECISALRAAVAASGALYYAECLGRLG